MVTAPLVISNAKARALILSGNGLCEAENVRGPDAAARWIAKLGYVQIDTIRIIERAHHHILFSRHNTYRPKHLERLQAKAPVLFEHWTHDASLIPLEHYPHWHHRFAHTKKQLSAWKENFGDMRVIKTVRAHIEEHGASKARDFAHLGGRTGPWWGWGPAKAALEFLWRSGELAVLRRDGFEKIYDLAARAVPEHLRATKPSRAETQDWACREALKRLGAATPKMLADFWGHASILDATRWIENERKAGRLIDVVLEGAQDKRDIAAVARPDIESMLATLPAAPSRLRALSPFDPVLRDRSRSERIFGFNYRIEIFVPEPKRKFGYYVFPLLEGDRFVGRIDMKADRDRDRLAVKALWLEPGLSLSKARQAKLERELERQARLAGVRDIVLPTSARKS